jgi:uncharacterized protein (DUF1501 family)
MKNLVRRDFLKLGLRSLFAIGAASVVGRLSHVSALAQSTCPTDYKALVCVFLFGGNDANNTVIPITTSNPINTYTNYATLRGGLALPEASLNMIGTSKGDQYGLHGSLKELANLYNSNKNVALLANVGSLVNPLTKAQYQGQSAPIPLNLFSHLDQQTEWQTSLAQGFATTGWGGRIADVMNSCTPGNFPMVISLDGNVIFGAGTQTNPATLGTGPITGLQGFTTCQTDARSQALCNLLGFDNGLSLVKASNGIASTGIQQATTLISALKQGTTLTTVFPNTSLGQQLAQVANIMNVRGVLGAKRQIFFTFLGGFDTHDMELLNQGANLQEVSQALQSFYSATQEMGISQSVVTFTESEFSRTMQPSGGATLGTDHAWGSHHIIMGDAVKGGNLYGTFPTQELQGPDDANNRGVWIPTTPVDQYGATLASWFGVPSASLGTVFPNLKNFASPLPAFL